MPYANLSLNHPVSLLMPRNRNNEQGNVFLIILIAVVLFGALIFTFSKSGSQGVSSISKQEAKIAAQEILNYTRLVEGAVDRVRRNGCSENEISFQNSTLTGYTNTDAPGDNSCHIFNENGGKVTVMPYDPKIHAGSSTAWIQFVGNNVVTGVGSTNADLIMIQETPSLVCNEINSLLNLAITDIAETLEGSSNFIGAFANTFDIGDQNTSTNGLDTFCVPLASGNSLFVKTLLAR